MNAPQAVQPRTWTKLDAARGWVMHYSNGTAMVHVDHLGRVRFEDGASGWVYSLEDPLNPVVVAVEPAVVTRTDDSDAERCA